jgi:hypothetical protein
MVQNSFIGLIVMVVTFITALVLYIMAVNKKKDLADSVKNNEGYKSQVNLFMSSFVVFLVMTLAAVTTVVLFADPFKGLF